MEKYVCYYRVSTKRQEESGLGLDSQRSICHDYIKRHGNMIVDELTEQESGGNDKRPMLLSAINTAKETGSVLLIAKLDRLSRSVSFISNLMDSKVKFQCVDIPDMNPLTIHIFSAMAEFELRRISERIKNALDQKRKREPEWNPGTNNLTDKGRKKAWKTNSVNARTDQMVKYAFHFIRPLREQGISYGRIAELLNEEGYSTRQGKSFHPNQVRSIYFRLSENSVGRKK